MIKKCSSCNKEKNISFFDKDRSLKDGACSKCKICKRAYTKIWQKNNMHKVNIYNRKWEKQNHEKYLAHKIVCELIRNNKLKKLPCVICNKSNAHAHHIDYSTPLEIIWLCPLHHKKIHKVAKKEIKNKLQKIVYAFDDRDDSGCLDWRDALTILR